MGKHERAVLIILGVSAAALVPIWFLSAQSQPVISENYLAERNAKAKATPSEQRAWPALYRPILAMEPIPDDLTKRGWPFTTDTAGQTPPSAEEWQAAREFVGVHEEQLADIRAAAGLPTFGIVLQNVVDPEYDQLAGEVLGYTPSSEVASENPPMWDILLPQISVARDAARILATDALIAAEDSDARRFTDDIAAIGGLARLLGQGFSLIEQISASDVEMLAHRVIPRALARPDAFTAEELEAVAMATEDLARRSPLADLKGEREFVLDLLQRTYSPQGHMTRRGAEMIAGLTMGVQDAAAEARRIRRSAAPREEIMVMVDRLQAAAENDIATPHWQREGWVSDQVVSSVDWEDWQTRYAAVTAMRGAHKSVANDCEQVRQRRDATRTIVALARHRLRHGALPEALTDIDADLLPAPPLDRFTGEPLRWGISETEAVLYSIGNDRDDDGGRSIADPDNLNWLPQGDTRSGRGGLQDGDWVLWRVPLAASSSD